MSNDPTTRLTWSFRVGRIEGETDLGPVVRALPREERSRLYSMKPSDAVASILALRAAGIHDRAAEALLQIADGLYYTDPACDNLAAVIDGLRRAHLLGPLSPLDAHAWDLGHDPADQPPAPVTPSLFG